MKLQIAYHVYSLMLHPVNVYRMCHIRYKRRRIFCLLWWYDLQPDRHLTTVKLYCNALIDACCTHLSFINSGVTGRKFTKFLSDVEGSLPMLMRSSTLQTWNSVWNASATNKGGYANVHLFQIQRYTAVIDQTSKYFHTMGHFIFG